MSSNTLIDRLDAICEHVIAANKHVDSIYEQVSEAQRGVLWDLEGYIAHARLKLDNLKNALFVHQYRDIHGRIDVIRGRLQDAQRYLDAFYETFDDEFQNVLYDCEDRLETASWNLDILKEDPGFVQSFPTGETPHRDSATPHEVGDLIQL